MNNKLYDPQAESLKVYWDSQQERLALLSGMPITQNVLEFTAAFGEQELQAFEKLMQTQRQLAALLNQAPAAPPVGVPNPVIDHLDMSDPRSVRRFEIRSVERSDVRRGDDLTPATGILLMLARKDSRSDAMADYFTGKGLTVRRIEENLTEERAQAIIAAAAQEGPITAMAFIANAFDGDDLNRCIYDHTMSAVYLIKHYTIYARELKPQWKGLMFFATFLDGKMGFTGESPHYAYGTFNGIAKTLSIEFGTQAAVKLIDFQSDVPTSAMVELMDDELKIRDVWPEIGRTNDGRRWTASGFFTDARVAENRCPYTREDVIVITGGSRGVTAQCIMALMAKAPCKVVILGRGALSDEHNDDAETARIPDIREMKTLIARRFKAAGYKGPFSAIEAKAKAILAQRDMRNTFRTLEATGSTVHYYSCDVNDPESLRSTMDKIHREVGPVRGIIHGAGLLADCKIWNKDMARFRAVLDTKYTGLNNLLSCVDLDRLKLVVSFSSVAGYFGNDGQMDYAAGNEFLDKFAHHFRKKYPHCKSLTINWGAWDGGMMDYIYRKTLTEKGYVLIPLEIGANYFANEFLNGLPYGQVLISNADKPVDATRPAE